MIRVAIKAASPVAQAGLERLLQGDPDIELLPFDGSADVIIVETDIAEIPADRTDDSPPVILLLDDLQTVALADVLRAGVKGLLPRQSSGAEIVASVHAVAQGLIVLDSLLAENVSSSVPPPAASGLIEPLTTREIEVLRLLAEGLGNKEIASCLNISEHTAKFHVASILGKLGATTRTEAVTLGIRYGLIMI